MMYKYNGGINMDKVFFKDLRENYWDISKVMGLIKETSPENEAEVQYIVVFEGGISTPVTKEMYNKLLDFLITIDVVPQAEVKEDE